MAREKVWVVRPSDGTTVGEIVARAGEPASAIAGGRVFVGKKRAAGAGVTVRPGDLVRIGAGEAAGPAIAVLHDRDDLVAVVKPAGLPTVPDHAGAERSLVALVARDLGIAAASLRITSRLDREVSGVVVFARTEAAEARLREARARGAYARRYVALALFASPPAEGIWSAPIGRHDDPRLRRVRGHDAKPATTRWQTVACAPPLALLAIDPVTGRTHQIRVHASDAGAPLLGDRDYGAPPRIALADGRIVAPSRIALHAARVVVPGLEAIAPIPPELAAVWAALGGEPEAWNRALTCETPSELP